MLASWTGDTLNGAVVLHVDESRKGRDSHTGIYIQQRNPSKLDQMNYGDGGG